MMVNEQDVLLSEIQLVNKPFPKHPLTYYYDQEILTFYNVATTTSFGQEFFNRGFIKRMCRTVNKMSSRDTMTALKMKMVFDQVESTKSILCRFFLPVDKDQRIKAITFLCNIYFSNENWIAKIICNQAYFTMISFSIK